MGGIVYVKNGDYDRSIPRFLASIAASTSLYVTTLSLRYLSDACKEMKRCVIALRSLNVAYKLCTMYELTICPSFVNKIYSKKRKNIKKKLKKMACSYCGRKGKLMCCTGCMKSVYCTKLCQKRDWRAGHRKKCVKKWFEFYSIMKD